MTEVRVRPCGNEEPHRPHVWAQGGAFDWRCPGVKTPGATVAEWLGIDVPDNAPGGQKIASPVTHATKPTSGYANEAEYQGFGDVDGYNRGRGDD